MNEVAKNAKTAYMKKWRQKNRDKVRAAQERYWLKKAAEAEKEAQEQSKEIEMCLKK